jgi:energy-coupling factor transport system permease protein
MDLYLDRDTAIHRLDPRVKILGLVGLFALALTFNHPAYVAAAAAAMVLIASLARCLTNIWRLRVVFVVLFVFSSVLWAFMLRGPTELLRLGGHLFLTRESVLYGVAVGLRLDAIVVAGIVFLSTTRVEEFTAGLRRLGLPFPMSFAFSLAFRFVPTFADSAYTIIQAQRSRGLDLESGGLLTRVRRHIPLLIPAVICAVRNTDVLAMALESRGFGGSTPRTEYMEIRMRPADILTCLVLLAAVATSLYWRLSGHGAVLPRL